MQYYNPCCAEYGGKLTTREIDDAIHIVCPRCRNVIKSRTYATAQRAPSELSSGVTLHLYVDAGSPQQEDVVPRDEPIGAREWASRQHEPAKEIELRDTHFFDPANGTRGMWQPFSKFAQVPIEDLKRLRDVARECGLVEEGENIHGALADRLPSRIAASVRPKDSHTVADALGARDSARKRCGELFEDSVRKDESIRHLERALAAKDAEIKRLRSRR